jgi:uncharacterized membrane protein
MVTAAAVSCVVLHTRDSMLMSVMFAADTTKLRIVLQYEVRGCSIAVNGGVCCCQELICKLLMTILCMLWLSVHWYTHSYTRQQTATDSVKAVMPNFRKEQLVLFEVLPYYLPKVQRLYDTTISRTLTVITPDCLLHVRTEWRCCSSCCVY